MCVQNFIYMGLADSDKQEALKEPISLTWNPMQLNDIFQWNQTKMTLTRHGSHSEKKLTTQKKISKVPSCPPHQLTPRYQFLLKSDKVVILQYGGHFEKKLEAPRSLNPSPSYQSITVCSHKHCMKESCGSKNKFDSTMMFGTSNNLKISIFIEIGQSWNFCDMAAILKKNGGSKEQFKQYHHVHHIKLPHDI